MLICTDKARIVYEAWAPYKLVALNFCGGLNTFVTVIVCNTIYSTLVFYSGSVKEGLMATPRNATVIVSIRGE